SSTSLRLLCLSQLHRYSPDIVKQAQRILAEYFSHVRSRIALSHQRLGNLRKVSAVFHADRHAPAIEIRTQPDMVYADKLNSVIDVLDDLLPTGFGRGTKLFSDFLAALLRVFTTAIGLHQLAHQWLGLFR